MRIVGLAAVIATLGFAAPAHGAAEQWKNLPYFNYDLHQLFVGTDKTWLNAKQVDPSLTPAANRPSWSYDRKLPLTAIWLPKCGRKAQRASFRKVVYVPGPASAGTAFLKLRDASGRWRPRGVKLLVNGIPVAKLKKTPNEYGDPLSSEALKLFRFGANTIEIKANRPKLPKGGKCNGKPGSERIGVLAGLFAKFVVDIDQNKPGDETHYNKTKPGTHIRHTTLLRMINRGPATSVEGGVGGTVGAGPYIDVESIRAFGSGGNQECDYAVKQKSTATFSCTWTDLAPNGIYDIHIITDMYIYPDRDIPANVSTTYYSAQIFTTPGPLNWNGSNYMTPGAVADPDTSGGFGNRWSLNEIYCFREPASDPGCANAPPPGG